MTSDLHERPDSTRDAHRAASPRQRATSLDAQPGKRRCLSPPSRRVFAAFRRPRALFSLPFAALAPYISLPFTAALPFIALAPHFRCNSPPSRRVFAAFRRSRAVFSLPFTAALPFAALAPHFRRTFAALAPCFRCLSPRFHLNQAVEQLKLRAEGQLRQVRHAYSCTTPSRQPFTAAAAARHLLCSGTAFHRPRAAIRCLLPQIADEREDHDRQVLQPTAARHPAGSLQPTAGSLQLAACSRQLHDTSRRPRQSPVVRSDRDTLARLRRLLLLRVEPHRSLAARGVSAALGGAAAEGR